MPPKRTTKTAASAADEDAHTSTSGPVLRSPLSSPLLDKLSSTLASALSFSPKSSTAASVDSSSPARASLSESGHAHLLRLMAPSGTLAALLNELCSSIHLQRSMEACSPPTAGSLLFDTAATLRTLHPSHSLDELLLFASKGFKTVVLLAEPLFGLPVSSLLPQDMVARLHLLLRPLLPPSFHPTSTASASFLQTLLSLVPEPPSTAASLVASLFSDCANSDLASSSSVLHCWIYLSIVVQLSRRLCPLSSSTQRLSMESYYSSSDSSAVSSPPTAAKSASAVLPPPPAATSTGHRLSHKQENKILQTLLTRRARAKPRPSPARPFPALPLTSKPRHNRPPSPTPSVISAFDYPVAAQLDSDDSDVDSSFSSDDDHISCPPTIAHSQTHSSVPSVGSSDAGKSSHDNSSTSYARAAHDYNSRIAPACDSKGSTSYASYVLHPDAHPVLATNRSWCLNPLYNSIWALFTAQFCGPNPRAPKLEEEAVNMTKATPHTAHRHYLWLGVTGTFVYPARPEMDEVDGKSTAQAHMTVYHRRGPADPIASCSLLTVPDTYKCAPSLNNLKSHPSTYQYSMVGGLHHLLTFFRAQAYIFQEFGAISCLSIIRAYALNKSHRLLFYAFLTEHLPIFLEEKYYSLAGGDFASKTNWVIATAHLTHFARFLWHRLLGRGDGTTRPYAPLGTSISDNPRRSIDRHYKSWGFELNIAVLGTAQRQSLLTASAVILNMYCPVCHYRGAIGSLYCPHCMQTSADVAGVAKRAAYDAQQALRAAYVTQETAKGVSAGKIKTGWLEKLQAEGTPLLSAPPKVSDRCAGFQSLDYLALNQELIPQPTPPPAPRMTAGGCSA